MESSAKRAGMHGSPKQHCAGARMTIGLYMVISAAASGAEASTRQVSAQPSNTRASTTSLTNISTNFEIGAKGDLLDGRLRLSAAAFFNELEGAYFFFYDPNTNTQNLGSAWPIQTEIGVRLCWVSTSRLTLASPTD